MTQKEIEQGKAHQDEFYVRECSCTDLTHYDLLGVEKESITVPVHRIGTKELLGTHEYTVDEIRQTSKTILGKFT